MKTSKKSIDLMHVYFGKKPEGKCGDCSNLIAIHMANRVVRKCRAYGVTSSAATDWAKKHDACGLFNKPISTPMISDSARQIFKRCGVVLDDDDTMQTTFLQPAGED